MNYDNLQSETIRWMRFPLAVAIVFSHAFVPDGVNISLWDTDYTNLNSIEVFNLILNILTKVFVRLARPCFFIFSGYLLYRGIKEWNRQIYVNKLKNRAKTLMIPYLLWNIIAVIITATYFFISNNNLTVFFNELRETGLLKIFWNYNTCGSIGTNIFGYTFSFFYPFDEPLWFIRDLIVMVILSPAIYYFIKYTKLYGVIVLGILFCTRIGIYTSGFSNDAFFFFGLGAYFSIHGKNMIVELRKSKIIWLSLTIISLILSLKYRLVFFQLYIVFGSITLINIATYIFESDKIKTVNKFISSLSKTSFFIFAAHSVLLLDFSTKMMNVIFRSDMMFFQYIKYLMAPIVCVSICVGLNFCANKIAPKIMKLLTGNR